MVNLNFYISSKVNIDLLEDLVPISELDSFTTSEFDCEEDLIKDKRYHYKIDSFKIFHSNYIRSIVEKKPDKPKIGKISILANIEDEEVQIRPFYKKDKKIADAESLRKNIVRNLRTDSTLEMLHDVIALYGNKLFFTDYNKIKYHYLRNVRLLDIYHKEKIGSESTLIEVKKELIRVIENELSKNGNNIYLYMRHIETFLHEKYKINSFKNEVVINSNNISKIHNSRLKKENKIAFVKEVIQVDEEVDYGLDFGDSLEYGFEENDKYR